MKTFTIFSAAVIAATLALTFADSVPGPLEIDFDRINMKHEEMDRTLNEAIVYVQEIAANESIAVGESIRSAVIYPLTSINIIILHSRLGTSIHMNTHFVAVAHFIELREDFSQLQTGVEQLLRQNENQLSPEARASIRAILEFTRIRLERLSEEILILLEDNNASHTKGQTQAVDWDMIVSKYDELEVTATTAINSVISVATNESRSVGDSIKGKLEKPMIQAQMFMKHPRLHARFYMLSEPQAEAHFILFNMWIEQIQEDLATDLEQLSARTRETIGNIFVSTNSSIDQLAKEIAQLFNVTNKLHEQMQLTKFADVKAVDWDLARSKVEELNDAINSLTNFVVNNATVENPAVGKTIEEKLMLPSYFSQFFVMHGRLATVTRKWSVLQASGHFIELKWITNNVKVDLANDLAQLSVVTQANIATAFAETDEAVSILANEIYVILSDQ